MASLFVKPKEGVKIRDPRTKKHLPESGLSVPATSYWRLAIAAGDVILIAENDTTAADK
jgi:hypothetical protein